ncbi:hypothetical protein N0V82_007052 [Gnomoniopsis sp. IMI 355080]|nr:hypothetical protein N0V82_007052 [Gnomoniopsis sp. IMI 355080]
MVAADEMSNLARQLRPRIPVNYVFDEDSDVDDVDEADNDTADDPQGEFEQPFELFGLPQELRDMVYSEALVDPYGVHLSSHYRSGVHDVVARNAAIAMGRVHLKRLSPNLLATCKRVYYEARLVAYRQPFIFAEPQVVHPFLLNLQPSTIGLLKDITLNRMRYMTPNNSTLLSGLRDAMSLTNFRLGSRVTTSEFQFAISPHRVGVEIATRFYKDASYFIRPFVASHGIDALLQVVTFQEADLLGHNEMAQGGQLSQSRKDTIMESVKLHLLVLLRGC